MARGYKVPGSGRKKGTPNKTTGNQKVVAQLIRIYILDIFEEYKKEQLKADLMALSPKTRVDAMTRMLRVASKVSLDADKELLELFEYENLEQA